MPEQKLIVTVENTQFSGGLRFGIGFIKWRWGELDRARAVEAMAPNGKQVASRPLESYGL
jgi:hypothetical protein